VKARHAPGRREPASSLHAADAPEPVRLDKWLWAARFYKTRALAAESIAGGRVEVNGQGAKPGRHVHAGDAVRFRLGPYEHLVTVRALTLHRGPAAEAAKLYAEDPATRAERERLREQHRVAAHAFAFGAGKPTKKERRALDEFRGRTND
jgi:ribosome-associated heat shock protein Hsp15